MKNLKKGFKIKCWCLRTLWTRFYYLIWHIGPSKRDLMMSQYKQVLGFTNMDPMRYPDTAQDYPGWFQLSLHLNPMTLKRYCCQLKLSDPQCSALGLFLEIRSYRTSYLSGILEGRRLLFQTFVPPGVEGTTARIIEGARSKQFLYEWIGLGRPLKSQQTQPFLKKSSGFILSSSTRQCIIFYFKGGSHL